VRAGEYVSLRHDSKGNANGEEDLRNGR
jgi:hypothetical protein